MNFQIENIKFWEKLMDNFWKLIWEKMYEFVEMVEKNFEIFLIRLKLKNY
jgi:hypothetical protein